MIRFFFACFNSKNPFAFPVEEDKLGPGAVELIEGV